MLKKVNNYTGKMMKKLLFPIFLLICSIGISQDPEPIVLVEKLENVNSTSDELMPIFSHDGKTMYYVRGFHPDNAGGVKGGQDIWFAELQEDSTWGEPKRFDKPLNNDQDNSVCGISADGKTLYLDNIYDARNNMHPGLSASKLNEKGEWSKAKAVEIKDFKPKPPFLEFSFPETVDKVLLISQENEDTTQKEDLYVSMQDAEGNWKKPLHMGSVLNSSGYEFAPFLDKDGKTLFFASSGQGGYGGSDLFKSTRLDDSWTNWSEPENLGPVINSDGFDAYYCTDTYGRAYFVRGTLSAGDDDIYSITYEYPEPKVIAKADSELVVKTVAVVPDPEPEVVVVPEPFDEKFLVLFDYDKAVITAKAKEVLKRVVATLLENDERNINVTGHTCDLGASEYNQRLSERRAKAVLTYLKAHGVKENRIKAYSRGLNQPKVENTTEENRAQNRRAEIHVFE